MYLWRMESWDILMNGVSMIKFAGKDKAGKPMFGFGLSEENIERLKDGQPIVVNMANVGRPEMGTVIICYGTTEKELLKTLTPLGGDIPGKPV